MRALLRPRRLRALLAPLLLLSLSACGGCEEPPADDDAGVDAGLPSTGDGGDIPLADGGNVSDGGDAEDAGSGGGDGGSGNDTASDAGAAEDGGGFSWGDLLGDAGLPDALACLPGAAPDLTGGVTAILDALDLHTYSGSAEEGVVCGDQICSPGVPCCVLCGYAACAEPDGDGGPATCPAFTQELTCDGPEDCDDPAADTCCYSLTGTGCRAAEDCQITLSLPDGGLPSIPFLVDGGAADAGALDAGSVDAGALDAGALDAGALDAGALDAGSVDGGAIDAGAPDAGGSAVGDLLGEILDQGVPVCRRLFDCDLLSGELCCTSDRFVNVELGLCMPALVCLGGGLP